MLDGNGEAASPYITTGPSGRTTFFVATFPALAKSGLLKDWNHDTTSFGSVDVKNSPTGPPSFYLRSHRYQNEKKLLAMITT